MTLSLHPPYTVAATPRNHAKVNLRTSARGRAADSELHTLAAGGWIFVKVVAVGRGESERVSALDRRKTRGYEVCGSRGGSLYVIEFEVTWVDCGCSGYRVGMEL